MKIVYRVLFLFVLIVALNVVVSRWGFGGFRLYVVESGSMTPAIKVGSVVLVKKTEGYKKNDVVTYAQSGRKDVMVTHRILAIENTAEGKVLTTKGDANEDADGEKVPQKDVVGKVSLTLPLFGYLVSFSRSIYGYILLIIIPATVIIFGELVTIMIESKQLMGKRKLYGFQKLKIVCLAIVFSKLLFLWDFEFTNAAISDRVTTRVVMTAGIWPTADLNFLTEDHKIIFSVFNTSSFNSLNYNLTYKTNGVTRGASGDTEVGGQNKITREEFTGYCSEGDCSNYTNIHDIELKVTLTDGLGNSKEIIKTL